MVYHYIMSTPPTPLSQRAGYTTAQICRLFGRSDGAGNIIPLHHNTILRWRQAGSIPFFHVNQRTIRYPRAQVDALLERHHEEAAMREPSGTPQRPGSGRI